MAQKNKDFISEIDQFLQAFDKAHPELSVTQRREVVKYTRIYSLRDKAQSVKTPLIDPWF